MAAALNGPSPAAALGGPSQPLQPSQARASSGPPHAATGWRRYRAPGAAVAVALVAVGTFYVALTDVLNERAGHAPAQVSVAPAVVQPPLASAGADDAMPVYAPAPPVRAYVARAAPSVTSATAELSPVVATPVRVAVTKCISSSGTAEYSDGPCAEGSRATPLGLQRDLNAVNVVSGMDAREREASIRGNAVIAAQQQPQD